MGLRLRARVHRQVGRLLQRQHQHQHGRYQCRIPFPPPSPHPSPLLLFLLPRTPPPAPAPAPRAPPPTSAAMRLRTLPVLASMTSLILWPVPHAAPAGVMGLPAQLLLLEGAMPSGDSGPPVVGALVARKPMSMLRCVRELLLCCWGARVRACA